MKRPILFFFVMLGIIIPSVWNIVAQEKIKSGYSLDELNRPVTWPQPQVVSVTQRNAGMVAMRGNKSEAAMRNTIPRLLCLTEKASLDLRPYFEVKLGGVYADVDEDPAAYQILKKFMERDESRPYQGGIEGFPQTIEGLRRYARLLQSRILARNGLMDSCRENLSGFTPGTGYEALLVAEIFALMGEKKSAEVNLAHAFEKPEGHPESNWGRIYIPLHGIRLAWTSGLDSLVMKWGTPFVAKGQDAERRPQWKSSWAIVNKIVGYSRSGSGIDWQGLKNGTYEGACRGFEGDLLVSVTIADGRMADLKITGEVESRPYSALTVIPQRILEHQTLMVDGVTGATVTSCAIITAAEEALIKASP